LPRSTLEIGLGPDSPLERVDADRGNRRVEIPPETEPLRRMNRFPLGRRAGQVHFRATLVMPFPIRGANACAVGDTAVWESEGSELNGQGFEMMARSSAP
jgi:hypothetical protein